MVKELLKRTLQFLLTGRFKKFKLEPRKINLSRRLDKMDLYLHIPFCKNLCPYCPYNKIAYDEKKAELYEKAVYKEIDLYERQLKNSQIGSLYIGGGTPTVMLDGLLRIVNYLRSKFDLRSDICIELNPNDMSKQVLKSLKDAGTTMVSIGVETFNDRLLKIIERRNNDSKTIKESVSRALTMGFDTVNVDLMFALPTQTLNDLDEDVKTALDFGVDQICAYPVFAFPYTELGKRMKIKSVKRPSGKLIRRMLSLIERRCLESGFERAGVWSFIKREYKKYSSVTKHYYKGFGAGAGSMFGDHFCFNTFSVGEYCKAVNKGSPVALSMPISKRLEMTYWLYWRLYDTIVNRDAFKVLFEENFNKRYGYIPLILRLLGFAEDDGKEFRITSKGVYWVHRIQNEYSLGMISKIWEICIKQPWPQQILF